MNHGDYVGVIVAAISAGILGLAARILKYWLAAQKQEDEYDTLFIKTLQNRILHLEAEHDKCLVSAAEQSKRIGYLEAQLAMMEKHGRKD